MAAYFKFDFPLALWIGLPLSVGLTYLAWQRLAGLKPRRRTTLVILRAVGLLALVFLAGQPVWVQEDHSDDKRPLALLLDRSQSMSLSDAGQGANRYNAMLAFLRERLLPALKKSGQNSEAFLFAHDAVRADGDAVVNALPDGSETNLAEAILQAVSGATRPPAAIIALTDGASNQHQQNSRALATLQEAASPFIGVGFGSDRGVPTLNIRRLDAPPTAPPKQNFTLGVQIEAITSELVPNFDLTLLRDGKLLETRRINGFPGSRFWLETFAVKEAEEGVHQYAAQLDLPPDSGFIFANRSASAEVRISPEKEVRVLFAQGALTWDFKFIARALQNDPMMKITGLSRTSEHSIFRQNVEAAGELLDGFPEKIEDIAPFRVVVLSDLQPQDFNPAQQETLARFCRELGGGVLLIGGQTTFGPIWRGSVLEQLLPVEFDANPGVMGLDQPFHLILSDDALRQPAFQIATLTENRAAWEKVPAFLDYGRVEKAKAGATILATHEHDSGPAGKRILMASQRYGAGRSAVLCVQNFWRWRLTKDTDPEQFDRFWRQILRWLGETSRRPVEISFPAQELKTGNEIQFIAEAQPGGESEPAAPTAGATEPGTKSPNGPTDCTIQVIGPDGAKAFEQKVTLALGSPQTFSFRGPLDGIYRVVALGALERELASRSIEIKDLNVEFQQTGRDMENLRQWASMTGGFAVKAEECDDSSIVKEIVTRIEQARESRSLRIPFGLNWWMLLLALGPLAVEWSLRRRWNLP